MATGLEDRKGKFSLAAAWNGSGAEPANTTGTISHPGMATVAFHLSGTFTGTLTWEATTDGTNYEGVNGTKLSSGVKAATATAAGIYLLPAAGFASVRARCSAFTSGPIVITALASV